MSFPAKIDALRRSKRMSSWGNPPQIMGQFWSSLLFFIGLWLFLAVLMMYVNRVELRIFIHRHCVEIVAFAVMFLSIIPIIIFGRIWDSIPEDFLARARKANPPEPS
jgi:hypothetical protein